MNADDADMLIRGGAVLDGLGSPPARRDVAVFADRVVIVEPGQTVRPEQVIDATGCFVTPGFIDVHGHSDLASLVYADATSRVASGVTTECNGNCGYGAFPMAGEVLHQRQAEYDRDQLVVDWTDIGGYFEKARQTGCAVNRVTLVGHGNLRGCVIGYGKRRAGPRQIDQMCRILDEAMAAGASGFSTGLIYAPGMWGDTDEIVALARVVAACDGLYTSHIRGEGDTLLDAVSEFLDILRRSGCRGQLSHVKVAGAANWTKIDKLRDMLHQARAEGLTVHADRYPYLASSTRLATYVLPAAAMAGQVDEVLARLADGSSRQTIRRQIEKRRGDGLRQWLESIVVVSVRRDDLRACLGKNLLQLPEIMGVADPLDAAIKLILDDRAAPQAVWFCMSEANLREIYSWDFVAMGSDSSVRDHLGGPEAERPHPRAYGSPVRFLDLCVRTWMLMDWPEAIRRMTSLPARILNLPDRGLLRSGARADITVFNPEGLVDHADYDDPCRAPDGIVATIVNGRIVWRNGRHTGLRPGRMLTHRTEG